MFDKILYINLNRRPERNKNVTEQVSKINLQYITERVEAVDGSAIDITKIPSDIISIEGKVNAMNDDLKAGLPLTRGAIGCALSHKKVYEKIINDNLQSALIIEDDITFDDNFMDKLKIISYNTPKEYDIIYLGYSDGSIQHIGPNVTNDTFIKSDKIYGTFGYIVTKEGAKKLLDIFPITNQIDSEISAHFDKINAYALIPEKRLIMSEPSSLTSKFGTDIQFRKSERLLNKRKVGTFATITLLLFCLIMMYFTYYHYLR